MATIKEEALDRGVHEECFRAGPRGACSDCSQIIFAIFDERYGGAPVDGLSGRILRDLQAGIS